MLRAVKVSTGRLRVRSCWKSKKGMEAALELSVGGAEASSAVGRFGTSFDTGILDVGGSFSDAGASFNSGSSEDLSSS